MNDGSVSQARTKLVTKRSLDLLLTIPALIVLAPAIVATALAIRWRLGSPVLFRSRRPGCGGVPFPLFKFRTMTDARNSAGHLLPDSERLTRFGKFLRAASLDELPQLLNVLRGEMSLVGPRPLPMIYLDRYSPEQSRRHELRPGVTGWAQINGRNEISWAKKFELDVWYVDHRSLWLDLKILMLTAISVLNRAGINQQGEATAAEFLGIESASVAKTMAMSEDPSHAPTDETAGDGFSRVAA